MCYIFASTDPALFEKQSRSLRINGVVTSLQLEARFWEILDEIAASQNMSTPKFISTLYDEVIELRGEIGNFASLLRVVCTAHLERQAAPALAAE